MAHNSKVWPGGLTDTVTTIDHTELGALDANAASAVNGDEGGTWSPATPIIIGGSGLEIQRFHVGARTVSASTSSGVAGVNWIFDATGPDTTVLCDTRSGPVTIKLPAPTVGRVVIVTDSGFAAATNPITLLPDTAGSDPIDGVAASYIITANGASLMLIGDGAGWKSIGKA